MEEALQDYFDTLDGEHATGVYKLVMAEVEAPLLAKVMKLTQGNQSKAALWLGLNRGTLRKLLKQYDIE